MTDAGNGRKAEKVRGCGRGHVGRNDDIATNDWLAHIGPGLKEHRRTLLLLEHCGER
jgi:hypothetical protein